MPREALRRDSGVLAKTAEREFRPRRQRIPHAAGDGAGLRGDDSRGLRAPHAHHAAASAGPAPTAFSGSDSGHACALAAIGSASCIERQPAVPGEYVEEGVASWYGDPFNGRRTSNGEVYDMHQFTAAHRTLPFGAIVRVTNLRNGKQTEVRINDRGPFVANRVIDLSLSAAQAIEMVGTGTAPVRLEIIERAESAGGILRRASGRVSVAGQRRATARAAGGALLPGDDCARTIRRTACSTACVWADCPARMRRNGSRTSCVPSEQLTTFVVRLDE